MFRWSLRTKLVAVIAIASLPVVAVAAWQSYQGAVATEMRRASAMAAAVEVASSRHRELLEGARHLLQAACSSEVVRLSVEPAPGAADLARCGQYAGQLVSTFGGDYSEMVVTDDHGIARCSSTPAAIGLNVADREIFRLLRQGREFTIGSHVASRVAPRTVIPVGLAIQRDGQFQGMCAIGISLKKFGDFVTARIGVKPVEVVLVDGSGAALAGDAETTFALSVPVRIASAIAEKQRAFLDYGQNGILYSFLVEPLADGAMFAVVAAPLPEGIALLREHWLSLALIVLAVIIMLVVVWLVTGSWVIRPLGQLERIAGRVARGEEVKLLPDASWAPEMVAVGTGIMETANAIASREAALHAGLEQRDHMLREIHHRVKNNLQMISSLLNLQAGEIRSPRIRRYFSDAQNRVLTLSILHRHLYERSSWSLVDFQQFISDLVRQLSVGRPGVRQASPRFQIRAPIMAVGPDTAIPVGLIVTEAVSSALGHDFSGVSPAEVRIEAIERAGRDVELVIEDNGRAGEASIGPDSGGFSMTLIRGLATQLGGEARVLGNADGGTRVVVTFPLPDDEPADA